MSASAHENDIAKSPSTSSVTGNLPTIESSTDLVEQENVQGATSELKRCGKTCQYGCFFWCRKYFWEGQMLKNKGTLTHGIKGDPEDPCHKRMLTKYRRYIGLAIPAVFFHFFWWGVAIRYNVWGTFTTKWPMSITMVFGSMIAGMTSEGGGAIAFPVMTLVLKISPAIARDFSCMIQSCGMSAATFTIFFMRITVEYTSLVTCSIGGAVGMIFGLQLVDPVLSPQAKKMGFVSIWFAFASVLVILNRTNKRKTFSSIQNPNWWKILVLFAVGFLGGIFTSFAGSGLDICSFSVLTLLFRISEKVATPTSVILMAGNSLVGFYWRGVMMNAISVDAWEYFSVCVPIVVIGAPLGSVIGSHFHRLVLASMVIIIDVVALIGGFAIVRPLSGALIGTSVALIVGFFGIFLGLTFAGQKLLDQYDMQQKVQAAKLSMGKYLDVEKGFEPNNTMRRESHAELNPTGISNVAFHLEGGQDEEAQCNHESN